MTYQTGPKIQSRTRSDCFVYSVFVPRSWRGFGLMIFLVNNLEVNSKHFANVSKSRRGTNHEKGDC